MKKGLIFAAVVASLGFSACTNDDVIETASQKEISFRASLGTRATELNEGNIQEICVSAKTANGEFYFNDVVFHKNGKDAYTPTSGSYLWPAFTSLKFYAHYPSTAELGASHDGTNKLSIINVTPKLKVSEQVDFVTAVASGSQSEATTVNLSFQHQFSQINVYAKNTNPAYTYYIRGVKFGNFVSRGNFHLEKQGQEGEELWEYNAQKSNYIITYARDLVLNGNSSKEESLMGKSGCAMLLPQQLEPWDPSEKNNIKCYIGVLLQICTSASKCQIYPNAEDKYAWAAVPADFLMEPGKKYDILLDFSEGAGYVGPTDDYTSDEWTNSDNVMDPEDIDPDMATDHLGEKILGGKVGVTPLIKGWENGTPTSGNPTQTGTN